MNRRGFIQPFLGAGCALLLGLALTSLAGENPFRVLHILFHGAFGSSYDFGMTLFYATPLIFTGLSVAFAFRAGLFNIGAEGQLTMGALAAALTGILMPGLPFLLAPPVAALAAVLAGGAWGAIPGWLKVRRGSHEVVNTIMLNFIASGLASYVTVNLVRDSQTQNPETKHVAAAYMLPQFAWFNGAPVNGTLILALLAALAMDFLLKRTVSGFELRILGQSQAAAELAGVKTRRVQIWAFIIAGGLAGAVGVNEVLGNVGKFRLGFSPEYGFTGIAVALLARNHPLGIIPAALLFGALQKGTSELDLESEHVTREVALIFQGLVMLAVSAEGLWSWTRPHRKPKPVPVT